MPSTVILSSHNVVHVIFETLLQMFILNFVSTMLLSYLPRTKVWFFIEINSSVKTMDFFMAKEGTGLLGGAPFSSCACVSIKKNLARSFISLSTPCR